jgi:hypothetical protein
MNFKGAFLFRFIVCCVHFVAMTAICSADNQEKRMAHKYIDSNKSAIKCEQTFFETIPADGESFVNLMTTRLSWSGSACAVSYDVYFGTEPDLGTSEYQGRQNHATFDLPKLLLAKTTYYWRIDKVDKDNKVTKGKVWSFTTESKKGRFLAYDATNKIAIYFGRATISKQSGKILYNCRSGKIELNAEFSQNGKYIETKGTIKNLAEDDRGIILRYIRPLHQSSSTFYNRLNESVRITESDQVEGNVYPIAAMCGATSGMAVAIPPSEPRSFGVTGGREGLGVVFYLGLTPETLNFPNTASFSFISYPVAESSWGFRSALSDYYSFYPDYYSVRMKTLGGWVGCALADRVTPNIKDYAFIKSAAETMIERDENYGILSFLNGEGSNIGVREIRNLLDMPADYNEAMEVYKKYCCDGHDAELCESIDNSYCLDPSGKRHIMMRESNWGGASIAFKVNPNPYIPQAVGSKAIAFINQKIDTLQGIDGVYMDSLGSRWPGILNYRREHFSYAQYPLTFGPDGKVAVYNAISHYEYMELLRKNLKAKNKFIWGNGIYEYRAHRRPPEHYSAKQLGRFFIGALVDVAVSEGGSHSKQDRWEFARASMGKKFSAFLNYKWNDATKVNEYTNKGICYAIFTTNSKNNHTGQDYIDDPNGYRRYKDLVNWALPLTRTLSSAGWEPVTFAKITSGKKILIERYGCGETVYFALMSEFDTSQKCVLKINLESLGFNFGEVNYSEVARNTTLTVNGAIVTLELKPFKTCVIKLHK